MPEHPLSGRYDATLDTTFEALSALGTNQPIFGRRLPPLFYRSELEDVGSSATYDICAGRSDWAEMLRLAVVSITEAADSIPGLNRDDLLAVQTALADPDFYVGQMSAVRAWGRKP